MPMTYRNGVRAIYLMTDEEQEGDHIIKHEDSKIPLVWVEHTAQLEGVAIDYQDTPEGLQLVISKDFFTGYTFSGCF